MYPEILVIMTEDLLDGCRAKRLKVATVESCTGGLIAGLITSVAGSSDVFERGLVTYANDAKISLVGVPAELLSEGGPGAVSEACARAMAEGALKHAPVDLTVAVTGIAGPGGGTAAKPVGLVHMASARTGFDTRHERHVFKGDRERVRIQAVESAMRLLNQMAAL